MYIYNDGNTQIFPYSLTRLRKEKNVSLPADPGMGTLRAHSVYRVVDAKPEYDPERQRLIMRDASEFQKLDGVYHAAYDVIQLSEEEFNNRQQSNDRVDQSAIKKLLKKQLDKLTVEDEEINDYASLFPVFRVGESVLTGDRRQYKGEVWEVIQGHTTQIDWLPPDVPALWKRVYDPDVISAWVQPTGAHDAYDIGDKVTHNGKTWTSTINANTTEPGTLVEHGYWE